MMMLNAQVAMGIKRWGNLLPRTKLISKINPILSAEKPCKAQRKMAQKGTSKDNRFSNLLSASVADTELAENWPGRPS